jgi:V-type H+-transporting ATPase subunit E
MEEEQRHYRDAEGRVGRFLQFIKKYAKEQEKKVAEEGEKEEGYVVSRIRSEASSRDEETFRKMEDNVKVAEKIFKSRKINECKMQEMKVRFDMIERVQEEAKQQLRRQSEDPQRYRPLLKQLIMQGLIKLCEQEVEVRCMRSDEKLVS